jgi:hypothetical protein
VSDDLGARLAREARAYIQVHARHPAAEPGVLPWLSDEEQEQLGCLSSGLARFLGALLDGHAGWAPYQVVDDLLPESAMVPSPTQVEVRGLVAWWDGRGGGGRDPFLGSLRVSPRQDRLESYVLRFGDAAFGLGRYPWSSRRRPDPAGTSDWLFVFKGSSAARQAHGHHP